jgi:hypothetical protein
MKSFSVFLASVFALGVTSNVSAAELAGGNGSFEANSFTNRGFATVPDMTVSKSYAVEFFASERVGSSAGTSFSASVNTTVSTCINVTGELKITNAALKISDTLTAAGYVIVNHK